ncbi:MAG: hypothetical protein HY296_03645 [Thaumarchaeota archaeon]|nr:hypothetical protein [Nitrososphaerota archaeon]
MIASLSGIRGVLNSDLSLADVARFAGNFADAVGSKEVLMARDTRSTGPTMCRALAGAIASRGSTVVDYGIISTPALFRESRLTGRPAVMVTASHNEPEFNGLKFLEAGRGIGPRMLDAVLRDEGKTTREFQGGRVRSAKRTSYADDLVSRFGEKSCDGVRVALDLGGGAAISHAVKLMTRLGCQVVSVNDAYGVFSRRVDPVSDDLSLLCDIVKKKDCDIGLGFDCDGDRLVVVDSAGRKRSGDFMLAFALMEVLAETREKNVVVSVDTTQAVDDVVGKTGGKAFRSKVGEANVVSMMQEKGARIGGEGSSGGLIDGGFNYCRDSMLAALLIIGALKRNGRRAYGAVPAYHQSRMAMKLPRAKAAKALRKLAAGHRDTDGTDGVKIRLSRKSWVLLRPSGTEDVVRVSAEAESQEKAANIARSFSARLKEMSR